MKVSFAVLVGYLLVPAASAFVPTPSLPEIPRSIDLSVRHSHSGSNADRIDSVRGGSNSVSKVDGIRTILGGSLAHLVFGSLYCWGNFQGYAPASLRFFDGQVHSLRRPITSPLTEPNHCGKLFFVI
jgi:hypothetical protein